MTTEEVLAGAAEILEQKGWLQHKWKDAEGRGCLLGALQMAGGGPCWYQVKHAIAQEIGLPNEGPIGSYGSLIDWNNQPGRIKEEVISAIRNAKRWL